MPDPDKTCPRKDTPAKKTALCNMKFKACLSQTLKYFSQTIKMRTEILRKDYYVVNVNKI